MTNKRYLSVEDVQILTEKMVEHVRAFKRSSPFRLFGVPRGGIPVAMALCPLVGGVMVPAPERADVIIDDIYDSGATFNQYKKACPGVPFMALIDKREDTWRGQWVVLPWEVRKGGIDASAEDIVTRLLEYIGEDPLREGLRETPQRVLKAWKHWASGYGVDPKSVLKVFTDGAEDCGDEFVIVHNIPIVSKCEHHLADITGIAHVGYIPNGKIVGLSKLPRIVEVFARRLQVQERLTNQIANAINEGLEPKGVGVIVRASHACMSSRGVAIHGSVTTTSAVRGALLEKPEARAEFLQLCSAAEK